MLRYTPEIFYGIERYLIDHKIPCCAHENAGIITFRAICEAGKDEYEYQINVSQRSFWIKAAAPVVVPQKEKVIRRMEKFCNQVNLRDDAGGFLVLNDRGNLMYRLYAPCFGDPQEVIRTMLPVPGQMLDCYKEQMELLVEGNRSVNEVMKYLGRTCRRKASSCLLSPREESGVRGQELQYSDRLRDMMEAYFYNFENTGEVEKS